MGKVFNGWLYTAHIHHSICVIIYTYLCIITFVLALDNTDFSTMYKHTKDGYMGFWTLGLLLHILLFLSFIKYSAYVFG